MEGNTTAPKYTHEGDSDDESQTPAYETLMGKLLFSADDESNSMYWEPGRINQLYVLTTEKYGTQAEKWLEGTINYYLLKYGIAKCQDRFATGVPEMPRSETKVWPDTLVLNYIVTLGIEEKYIVGQAYRNRAPPITRLAKSLH